MEPFKPLLAYTIKDLKKIEYPVYCSPKIDGIRCIVREGKVLTRTLKPVPNVHIRKQLEQIATEFPDLTFDGELIVGNTFQETTSGVMSHEGEPEFTYWIFDVLSKVECEFYWRYEVYMDLVRTKLPSFCRGVEHIKVDNEQELLEYYRTQLELGYEGVMVRGIESPYKYGRSTEREGILGKLKPFRDSEFQVIGFEPYYENTNPSEINELGYLKKSKSKEGLVACELLGAFIVKTNDGVEFGVASGLTMEQRKTFWEQRETLLGKWIKVKYLDYGIKEAPRHPVFLGIRED